MTRDWLLGSTLVVGIAVLTALSTPGCTEGGNGSRRDGGGGVLDGGVDGAVVPDANLPMPDAGADAGEVADTGVDAGTAPTQLTCETCDSNADCVDGFCARLVTGGRACLPGCVADLPECPRSFSCIFDATGTGVDATICAPVGGPCCVDEDGDGYGQGVGCTDVDCDDTNPTVHPDRTELCDGLDTNCNGVVDESPTECEGGVCRPAGDGFEALATAVCSSAMCGSTSAVSCGLYTCAGGGADGTTCASTCTNPTTGADDDAFCIASAHCDAGACVADVVDGTTCDEDGDCTSAHCDSDICCASGDCCTTVAQCPGGGAPTRMCTDPLGCQGARGEATCNATTFRCEVASGIPDDSACDATVTARDCGVYAPVVCNGSETQTPRTCSTTCFGDGDCIGAAHCEVGFCVPDRPAGLGCTRNADCQDGLSCADGVCCTTSCTGSCESCNLPGTAGTCTPVPAGGDPNGECAGFSCGGYYGGFGAGSDVCYRRADISDAAATCDGAGACRSPDVLCPTQPLGVPQVDCNDTCQTPQSGTCTGVVAGVCNNLDNPAVTLSCGTGICANTVQRCIGGALQMCVPATTPVVESCDGLDNDCNGTVDNGGAALCTGAVNVAAAMCTMGACEISMSGGCLAGFADIDRAFANGCECDARLGATTCGSIPSPDAITLATSGSVTRSGSVPPGEERWFQVNFPSAVLPGVGTPRVALTAGAVDHELLVTRTCVASSTLACSVETAALGSTVTSQSVTVFEWSDSNTMAGPGCCSSLESWPSTVYVRVRRRPAATTPTTCGQTQWTLAISR